MAVAIIFLALEGYKVGSRKLMVQNIALIVWPLLMVLSAIIPVLLGLREYRRGQ